MKKKIVIGTMFCLLAGLSSCDYLDQEPIEYWQAEDIFQDPGRALQALNTAYQFVPGGYGRISNAFQDGATDDGAYVDPTHNIYKLAQGFATSMNPIDESWSENYQGIRRTFYFEENIHYLINWDRQTEEYIADAKAQWVAESQCLRALYYFDLLRRYGGVPLVTEMMSLEDSKVKELNRSNFSDCVDHIVNLCTEAAKILKETPWAGDAGRMTKGAALAIKAKTLAYAASPLYNGVSNPLLGYTDSNVQKRWELAAEALKEVIEMPNSPYALHTNFTLMFTDAPSANKEYIVMKTNPQAHGMESTQFPPSISGGGGTCPTQNLAEEFEMRDGSPYDPSKGLMQFENRDPRFAATFLYDGMEFKSPDGNNNKGKFYTHIGEDATLDALGSVNNKSTLTGYYLRKLVNPAIDLTKTTTGNTYHIYPIIRLADIYLLYAEAMNEAYGPTQVPEGYTLSAVDAVNKVRTRASVGMPTITAATTPELKGKIVHERRVEFAFEEQRYYDLKRWKLAEQELSKPVTGLRLVKSGGKMTASVFNVDANRRFTSKMYYAPIPYTEIRLSPNVVQNPEW